MVEVVLFTACFCHVLSGAKEQLRARHGAGTCGLGSTNKGMSSAGTAGRSNPATWTHSYLRVYCPLTWEFHFLRLSKELTLSVGEISCLEMFVVRPSAVRRVS